MDSETAAWDRTSFLDCMVCSREGLIAKGARELIQMVFSHGGEWARGAQGLA